MDIRSQLKEAITHLDDLRRREREALNSQGKGALTDRLRDGFQSHEPDRLAFVTTEQLQQIFGLSDVNIVHIGEALEALTGETGAVVEKIWIIYGLEEETLIDADDVREWKETGLLVDPHNGEIIENPDRVMSFAWAATTSGR